MPAAFRPRFRRGTADAEPEEDSAGAVGEEVADEGVGAEGVAGDADAWLAYELHEWSLESRVMLQQLLTVDQVVHSWQGTTLMVHESLEAQVDSLVDEVEETERAKEAISRPIGPEDSLTAFELSEWPEALRAELMERLVQASVPYILDTEGDVDEGDADEDAVDESDAAEDAVDEGDAAEGDVGEGDAAEGDVGEGDAAEGDVGEGDAAEGDVGEGDAAEGDVGDGADADDQDAELAEVCDLLVREADEERVELVIDDLLAREEEAQFVELDGLEVNDLLSSLFVACDRLRRDPRDPDGVQGVVTNARRIAVVRTPFGFSAPDWRGLRNTAGELLDLVQGPETDKDDLRERAHRMSDTLRMLI